MPQKLLVRPKLKLSRMLKQQRKPLIKKLKLMLPKLKLIL
jgi:hypothetical protein|tara:strand:+ start:516 stop:635 length:120 start_codon:yes stop_codon:yes gene_type:complete